ncbi:MAG: ABC transporter ATP-binding protein [Deltaproteobacteria bacterium]|nr:ABC transporter ATP-binding protein [Deltaproteobacteria bacterium]
MLQVDRVTKQFGKLKALDELTLAVPEGQIFGLLGPNGAGKSTLIRIITGLLPPTSGTITLLGSKDPTDMEIRRQVGYMPQDAALYPGLTIAENVRFFGRIYGVPETVISQRMEEDLELVELTHRKDSVVETLSGGMVRRTMLLTALIHRPRFLILDEPTVGVDPELRLKFWDWLAQLVQRGSSILITTHHISEAVRCAKVVFLREGKRLEEGPPRELMARYGSQDLEEAFVKATSRKGGTP